jgi:hypothetical protein
MELSKVQTVRVHELPMVFRGRSYLIECCIARLRACRGMEDRIDGRKMSSKAIAGGRHLG